MALMEPKAISGVTMLFRSDSRYALIVNGGVIRLVSQMNVPVPLTILHSSEGMPHPLRGEYDLGCGSSDGFWT